jgi:1-deoxy-D-xylulose-5-phosphate synthase
VTLEENVIAGGAGSAVNDYLQRQRLLLPVLNIGLPDRFVEQGSREELLSLCGLDARGILQQIQAFCAVDIVN